MAATFQVTPEIKVLDTGTLSREFEASVKAARFVDRRGWRGSWQQRQRAPFRATTSAACC